MGHHPKGRLVTGTFGSEGPSDGSQVIQVLTLPAKAPVVLTAANLAFGTDVSIPGDPRCAGDSTAPNPASGVFCVYFYNRKGLSKPYLQPMTSWAGPGQCSCTPTPVWPSAPTSCGGACSPTRRPDLELKAVVLTATHCAGRAPCFLECSDPRLAP